MQSGKGMLNRCSLSVVVLFVLPLLLSVLELLMKQLSKLQSSVLDCYIPVIHLFAC